jgi:hypothetical protein
MAGLVLEYSRLFSAGKRSPVGEVEKRFSSFEDASLREMHRDMIASRNELYAHYTVGKQAAILEIKAGEKESEIRIATGRMDEGFILAGIPEIRRLALFQRDSFQEARDELFREFKTLPSGTVRFEPFGQLFHRTDAPLQNGWAPLQQPAPSVPDAPKT